MSVQYLDRNGERRASLMARAKNGDLTISNKEMVDAFAINPHFDVDQIPLDGLDPSHPALFAHDTMWAHFARLRREDPVH